MTNFHFGSLTPPITMQLSRPFYIITIIERVENYEESVSPFSHLFILASFPIPITFHPQLKQLEKICARRLFPFLPSVVAFFLHTLPTGFLSGLFILFCPVLFSLVTTTFFRGFFDGRPDKPNR